MGTCKSCQRKSPTISQKIGFCASCLRDFWQEIKPELEKIHRHTRRAFGLLEEPPRDPDGVPCRLCHHFCRLPEGESGYCGVWQNRRGRLEGPGPSAAYVSWYLDPLPTNCVADFVCAGGTGAGYPRFAHFPGPEKGFANLAVFYEACNFNCLYCQNWHFKLRRKDLLKPVEKIFLDLKEYVSCICYFGGDPGPQSPHALSFSRKALKKRRGEILRICWETNGAENTPIICEMMRLSMASGGCLKVDLKAFSLPIHFTLCGVSNEMTLKNFKMLASFVEKRPVPPPLVASTLLVPGYVDEEEIEGLAKFIASLSKDIPWSFLAFYPAFYLDDLPTTSRRHAEMAISIAKRYGIRRVHIGNRHLLSEAY